MRSGMRVKNVHWIKAADSSSPILFHLAKSMIDYLAVYQLTISRNPNLVENRKRQTQKDAFFR